MVLFFYCCLWLFLKSTKAKCLCKEDQIVAIVQTFYQSPSKCGGAFFDSANITFADGYVTQRTSKGEFIKRTCEDIMAHANVKLDDICGCNSMLDILSIKKGCTQGMYEGKKSAVFVACGVIDANKASASVTTGNTKSSTWCGCSGSDALEVYHDKYLSNDCSGSLNAQSRVTIDAKGVRQREFYNHSFPVDWTDIRGDALGNFQYLGALRFPAGLNAHQSIIRFQLLAPTKVPGDLRILMFDDQPISFSMISRALKNGIGSDPEAGDNTCKQKSAVSKSFQHCLPGQPCNHGVTVASFSHRAYDSGGSFSGDSLYHQGIGVNQTVPRTWHFVAANCAGNVDIPKYQIRSSQAVPFPGIPTASSSEGYAVQGFAKGGFDLLGTLCFSSEDATPQVVVEWDDQESPDQVNLLVYDEVGLGQLFDSHQAPSQNQIAGTEAQTKECSRRRSIAVQTIPLKRGASPVRFTLAGSAQAVGDKGVRRMTFIMERCVTSGPLKVKNVRIHAATAGDCAPVDYTSCPKPMSECSCESYSRAMNLEPFGTCKRGSITRCQAVSASTPSGLTTTTFSTTPNSFTSSRADFSPVTTRTTTTTATKPSISATTTATKLSTATNNPSTISTRTANNPITATTAANNPSTIATTTAANNPSTTTTAANKPSTIATTTTAANNPSTIATSTANNPGTIVTRPANNPSTITTAAIIMPSIITTVNFTDISGDPTPKHVKNNNSPLSVVSVVLSVVGAVVGLGAAAGAIAYWYSTRKRKSGEGSRDDDLMQQLVLVKNDSSNPAVDGMEKKNDTYKPPETNRVFSGATPRKLLTDAKKAIPMGAKRKSQHPKLKEVSSSTAPDLTVATSASKNSIGPLAAVETSIASKPSDVIAKTASVDADYTSSTAAAAFAAAGVPMSHEDFSYWWDDVACGHTIAAARVQRKIAQLRQRQESKMRQDAALALQMYGLNPEDVDLSVPVPIPERTLDTSNFLAVYNKVNERLDKLGKFPCMYIITAAQELVRTHSDNTKGSDIRNNWLAEFQTMLEEVLVNPDFENDVGSTAEFLWTSARLLSCSNQTSSLCSTQLCNILNEAIRSDDVISICHAVVFSRAINLRRVQARGKTNSFWNKSKVQYPRRIEEGEIGHGSWRDGVGVGHASWRGGGFRDVYKAFFVNGKKYRVPGVLATSLSKETALQFIDRADDTKPKILWCIRVDGRGEKDPRYRCKHASYVYKSLVPGEGEFLFAPYSSFRVEEIDWTGPVYTVVVSASLDNTSEPTTLPLAPWY